MKKNIILTRLFPLAMAATLAVSELSMAGCGKADPAEKEEHIVLEEPVGVAKTLINPEYRDMYKYEVVQGVICPSVSELSYDVNLQFDSFAKMPGELIKKGDAIVYGDTSGIDEQIKNLKEQIKNQETSHIEQAAELQKTLDKDKEDYENKLKEYEFYSSIEEEVKEPFKQEDGSYVFPGQGDVSKVSKYYIDQYNFWSRQYGIYDSSYRYALMTYERDQINLEKEAALYELDHAYNLQRLSSLQKERAAKVLYTNVAGTVVSINALTGWTNRGASIRNKGSWVGKNQSMAAVADLSTKEIKCKSVTRGKINTAIDYYAIINGKRYEVEYVALSSEESQRIYKRDGVVYSTFTVKDPDDTVEYGDMGVVVIVQDKRKDVMCVPTDCITKDESGSYVYVYEDGKYVATYVKTGLKDGQYTEILSGLTLDQEIKAEYKINSGGYTQQLERADAYADFTGMGVYFYPSTNDITNPVKHGTTYVTKVEVKKNQRVEKGDVLIRIRVVPDSIEIKRQERNIQRLNEQLEELVKDNNEDIKKHQEEQLLKPEYDRDKEPYEGRNAKSIKNLNSQIEDANKTLKEYKNDANTTAIKANRSGIVTSLFSRKEGDLISYNTQIASIADESSCFVLVQDENGQLSYGNVAEVVYEDRNGDPISVTGRVVTANAMSLSAALNGGFALVSLSADDMETLLKRTNSANNIGFYDLTVFTVTSNIRRMDNVLKVPRKAVTDYGGSCYVTVKEADGTLRSVSFISAGSDTNGYWVAEGLTEGMTICWE